MEEDGLFEQSHIEDEPLPPLSPGQEQTDPFGDGENGEVSKLADVPEAKRKVVKRPRPKLDSNRLTSDRGLPALRTLFSDVCFKGKGHEAEDLRLLMKRMENWAHRLFPQLQFEDFIDRVERLGSKKEVQTCLKRIRLDLPLTHEDYTSKEGEEEEAPPEPQVFGDPDPFGGEHLSVSPPRPLHSTPGPAAAAPPHSDDPSLGPPPPSLPSLTPTPPSLTQEQRRRMAENRLKALEKRRQKQQQETESESTESQPSESQLIPVDEAVDVSVSDPAPTEAQGLEEVPKEVPQEDTDPEQDTDPEKDTDPGQDQPTSPQSPMEQEKPQPSPSPGPEPEPSVEEEAGGAKEEEKI